MLLGSAYSRLSKRQREQTPLLLASWLVERTGAVAALWVREDTVYRTLGLDVWPASRNARLFHGPGPIIAHPPCGPWGKFAWNCKYQEKKDGMIAMLLVHKFGGVVEQPSSSSLFREYGCPCGSLTLINQADYGHPIKKPTRLFWHCPP
jgi:hypothetical protein